jgi:hypothetical protein
MTERKKMRIDSHALACLSYFEFRDDTAGLYMGKYPVDEEDFNATHTVDETTLARLLHRMPFAAVSAEDVSNFLSSLTGSVPAAPDGTWPTNLPDVPDYKIQGGDGPFEFGFGDMLGWLIADGDGVTRMRPGDTGSLVSYLNGLTIMSHSVSVKERQQTVQVRCDGFKSTTLYVRRAPKGQRAMDVIPLVLYEKGGKPSVVTTIGTRKRSPYVFNALGFANAGFTSGYIIGGGEHLEPEDRTTIKNTAAGMDIDTDDPSPKEIESKAAARAIKEEVGLSNQEITDMKVRYFVVGVHKTDEHSVVGRELRYWPRLFQGRVYGYPRAASTIIVAAVMKTDTDIGEKVLNPSDGEEIEHARFIEWGDVHKEFRHGGGYKPAFGWSHTRMIDHVNSRLVALVHAFSIPKQPTGAPTGAPTGPTGHSFGFRGMDYHTAAQIHHAAKAQAYGSMRMHRKAASHAQRAADHMRFGAASRFGTTFDIENPTDIQV